ncbi:hypothetical protein BHE74_00054312 [Ensete ventricosum]|nr:hypothetical protein GW17_00010070 [Ensete ventricosum]RWW40288.1 hypothetical protein BHE74_00054312 [Ensete ventricosum]RZR99513.1 hypothetical protein BHM03_00029074 [Ensete ventricosum]
MVNSTPTASSEALTSSLSTKAVSSLLQQYPPGQVLGILRQSRSCTRRLVYTLVISHHTPTPRTGCCIHKRITATEEQTCRLSLCVTTRKMTGEVRPGLTCSERAASKWEAVAEVDVEVTD